MVADAKPGRGAPHATHADPTETSQLIARDGPAAVPPVAPPGMHSPDEPLAPLATRWPHVEAELVRRRAFSRRR